MLEELKIMTTFVHRDSIAQAILLRFLALLDIIAQQEAAAQLSVLQDIINQTNNSLSVSLVQLDSTVITQKLYYVQKVNIAQL